MAEHPNASTVILLSSFPFLNMLLKLAKIMHMVHASVHSDHLQKSLASLEGLIYLDQYMPLQTLNVSISRWGLYEVQIF